MTFVVFLLFIFGVLPLALMWHGWVLQQMWAWFVIPTFNMSALTLAQAIGLTAVTHLITARYGVKSVKNATDDNSDWPDQLAYIFVGPLVALVIGWCAAQFM